MKRITVLITDNAYKGLVAEANNGNGFVEDLAMDILEERGQSNYEDSEYVEEVV